MELGVVAVERAEAVQQPENLWPKKLHQGEQLEVGVRRKASNKCWLVGFNLLDPLCLKQMVCTNCQCRAMSLFSVKDTHNSTKQYDKYIHIYIYIHMYIYMYMYMYMYTYIYMHVRIYTHVYIYRYIYI